MHTFIHTYIHTDMHRDKATHRARLPSLKTIKGVTKSFFDYFLFTDIFESEMKNNSSQRMALYLTLESR